MTEVEVWVSFYRRKVMFWLVGEGVNARVVEVLMRWWGPAAGYCPNQCTMSLTNRWIILHLLFSFFFFFLFLLALLNGAVAGITERSMVSLNDPTGICPTIPSIRTLHLLGHASIQCMIGSLPTKEKNVESPSFMPFPLLNYCLSSKPFSF